ncbi:hypothetical protein GN244_ATG00614 [Phytophthora infestans]|uniref:Uncharacterized protein n=1 Tax=Phytophthora infestans TaxID=4787 RepID=A0A833SW82_PHYIN|nr:hypothetical protein GN244_ATG00614 [Phytophthora infestans]
MQPEHIKRSDFWKAYRVPNSVADRRAVWTMNGRHRPHRLRHDAAVGLLRLEHLRLNRLTRGRTGLHGRPNSAATRRRRRRETAHLRLHRRGFLARRRLRLLCGLHLDRPHQLAAGTNRSTRRRLHRLRHDAAIGLLRLEHLRLNRLTRVCTGLHGRPNSAATRRRRRRRRETAHLHLRLLTRLRLHRGAFATAGAKALETNTFTLPTAEDYIIMGLVELPGDSSLSLAAEEYVVFKKISVVSADTVISSSFLSTTGSVGTSESSAMNSSTWSTTAAPVATTPPLTSCGRALSHLERTQLEFFFV